MIKILVDSASDYIVSELEGQNIDLVPIVITIDGVDYIEGKNISRDGFYKKITEQKKFAKTSLVSPQTFIDYFEKIKEANDEVIYISLSSVLSGTYNSAVLAKKEVGYDKIYLVDSLSASYAVKVLVDEALKLIAEKKPAEYICQALEALKKRIVIYAALDTLEFLKRGGRINTAEAFLGELVNLKPIITIDNTGKIAVASKALGKTRSMANIIKLITKHNLDSNYESYILYSYGNINVNAFEEKLNKADYHPKTRLQIGPVIGAHIGPEAFGVVMVVKE